MLERQGKAWTDEEDEKLFELYSQFKTNEYIAKQLDRSTAGVKRRLERKGSSKHLATGTITANELAKALGVDSTTIISHINEKGLPVRKFYVNGLDSKYNRYYINIERFWAWVSQHKDLYRWSKMKERTLLPEPDWLAEAIEKDKRLPKHTRKPWTPQEDDQLWNLYYVKNMMQKDIAKKMNRPKNGVERRLNRLRKMRIG